MDEALGWEEGTGMYSTSITLEGLGAAVVVTGGSGDGEGKEESGREAKVGACGCFSL